MKKIFIISLFIGFIAIFLSSSFEAKAEFPSDECDPGFIQLDPIPVSITVDGQTCDYWVYLCVKCDVSPSSSSFEIYFYCHGPVDINCVLDGKKVIEAINDIITDPNWIEQNISNQCFSGWPPCSPLWQKKQITYLVPMCWRKYNWDDLFGHHGIFYEACSDTKKCKTIYEVCWDGNEYTKTLISGPIATEGSTCKIFNTYPFEPPDPEPCAYSECFFILGDCPLY